MTPVAKKKNPLFSSQILCLWARPHSTSNNTCIIIVIAETKQQKSVMDKKRQVTDG